MLHPLSSDELAKKTAADRIAAQQDVEPITGPLSLDEAIARALKYNLDRRVKVMEEALTLDQLDAASWDMLDFGLSYIAAKEQADRGRAPPQGDAYAGAGRAHGILAHGQRPETVNISLGKCNIAAPFNGRVAEQRVREQQYVQPGQALLDILDDSTLELEFFVPSQWLVWLKPEQGFQVAIDETGKTYPAKVQRIGARVDPVSQSIKLSAVIDGKFSEPVAGMSGRC